jgi:hypothetical protein
MAFFTRFGASITSGVSQMSGYSNVRDTNRLHHSFLFCVAALEKPLSPTASPAEISARIELSNSVDLMRSELSNRGCNFETQNTLFTDFEGVQPPPRSGEVATPSYLGI